jgi:hypothetical protein
VHEIKTQLPVNPILSSNYDGQQVRAGKTMIPTVCGLAFPKRYLSMDRDLLSLTFHPSLEIDAAVF